ncbi:hypothetical protein McPS_03180 [Marichromatium sp. PS1]
MFGALGPVATLRDALIRPPVDHQRHPDLFGCALLITAVPLFAFSWLSERHIDAGHRQGRETDRWTVTPGRGRLVPTAALPAAPLNSLASSQRLMHACRWGERDGAVPQPRSSAERSPPPQPDAPKLEERADDVQRVRDDPRHPRSTRQ